jgi:sulfur-oxidizing protein SoxZ
METGYRREQGQRVKRNAIHSLACKYDGTEVFRATLSTGIAANPYLRFFMRAKQSGDLDFWWLDDDDVEGTAKARLVVG